MSDTQKKMDKAVENEEETILDVSFSKLKGRKLRKEVEKLLEQMQEQDIYPSLMVVSKDQYKAMQEARKLRRLKANQWEFLKMVSPPENFLYYSKQHVMGVQVDETR